MFGEKKKVINALQDIIVGKNKELRVFKDKNHFLLNENKQLRLSLEHIQGLAQATINGKVKHTKVQEDAKIHYDAIMED